MRPIRVSDLLGIHVTYASESSLSRHDTCKSTKENQLTSLLGTQAIGALHESLNDSRELPVNMSLFLVDHGLQLDAEVGQASSLSADLILQHVDARGVSAGVLYA